VNRNLWSRILSILTVLLVGLMVSHPAFAKHHDLPDFPLAPEMDPRLAIEGLAVAGGVALLIWERMRRKG
jgi:hypothetical protein